MAAAPTFLSFLLIVAACTLQTCNCGQSNLARTYERHSGGAGDEVVMLPRKRPFCNGFAGCGGKRSGAAPGNPLAEMLRQKLVADEEFSPDEELNQDLTRQLLSEARILEAIQESNQQPYRKKLLNYPMVYNLE